MKEALCLLLGCLGLPLPSLVPVLSSSRCSGGEEGRKAYGEAGVDAGRGGEKFWGGAERSVQVLSQRP